MAQCEKILEKGQRCSNQAVPGTRFCLTHGRITFKPAPKAAPDQKSEPPKPKPAAKPPPRRAPTPEKPALWRAAPSSAGQAPALAGLRPDERNILVAPQGVIWLPAPPRAEPADNFNRLQKLLAALSQAVALAGQVRALRQPKTGDALINLSPARADAPDLSVFYDAAAAAARLAEATLYIGQGNAFVRYRDNKAPRGYDVPGFKAAGDQKKLLLIAPAAALTVDASAFAEAPLAELCLQIAPRPGTVRAAPDLAYVLAPPPLYPVLARYFRAHHLRYSLARLPAPPEELILFEISPRPDAPAGRTVPTFILDYVSRLPRVALLVEAHEADGRRVLLHWGYDYPLHLPHTAGLFASGDLILLVADYYPNLRINPAPQFFDGDRLAEVEVESRRAPRRPGALAPLPVEAEASLKLPVALRPDDGPTPPIAALILSSEEVGWLSQLLYRLPGEAFGAYLLCQGRESAVLVGGSRPVEGIPFGLPLRRLGDTELFLPLRSRFVPDLPWTILREALAIKDNHYTFLTPDYRLDLPASAFSPLSRTLIADPNRPLINFTLRPGPGLPDLPDWKPLPTPAAPEAPSKAPKGDSLWGRITDVFGQREPPPPSEPRPRLRTPRQPAPSAEPPLDPAVMWLQQARDYESKGDYLAAALCYGYLGDPAKSANCFRRAAAEAKAQGGRKKP
jgi:hypothetical protein